MSAYMVDDTTINRVVSHIRTVCKYNRGDSYQYKQLLDSKYPLDSDVSYNKLADDMFKLNIEGVNERYGENEAEKFRPLDFQYQFIADGAPRVWILKALQCWMYQCSEGDIPETSELYKTMREVINVIALSIVNDLPEYEKAPWG